MRLPCEIAVKKILPTVRALIAYILVHDYKLSIYSTAKLMDLTPAAISNYVSGGRGAKYRELIESDPELREIITRIARKLVEKGATEEVYSDICRACTLLRSKCPN